jgi:hypothetical protein
MTRLLVPLVTLGLLACLASYSFGKHVSREWHHPVSQGEFVARKLAEYQPRDAGVADRVAPKTVYIWRDKKSAALADALSLTVSSIDDTVDVRRAP